MIEINDIEKTFDDKQILFGISAKFYDGKTNLIIGQSGSGKTVLMKSLVGLVIPEKGEILFDGRDLMKMSISQRKDLRKEIDEGHFREDLYHRLSVIVIKVPSLDERRSDIPMLIDYFCSQIADETALPRKTFSPEAVQLLQERSWRGNIRELRNVVERLLILGDEVVSAQNVKDYV